MRPSGSIFQIRLESLAEGLRGLVECGVYGLMLRESNKGSVSILEVHLQAALNPKP